MTRCTSPGSRPDRCALPSCAAALMIAAGICGIAARGAAAARDRMPAGCCWCRTIRPRSPTASSRAVFDAEVATREIEAALAAERRGTRQELCRSCARPECADRARTDRQGRCRCRRRRRARSRTAGSLHPRTDRRRAGRSREPRRHRARRPVRVRRYPRRGARRLALARGAGGRHSDPRPRRRSASRSPPAPMPRSAPALPRASGCRWSRPRARPDASRRAHGGMVGALAALGGRWIGRCARRLRAHPLTDPALAVRAVREAVKVEKADDLFRLARDVGARAGQGRHRAALDGLKIADNPARDGACRQARREAGRQDARDPEAARPRRHRADGGGLRSVAVGALGGADGVRLHLLASKARSSARPGERLQRRKVRRAKRELERQRRLAMAAPRRSRRPAAFARPTFPTCQHSETATSRSPISTRASGREGGEPIVLIHGFASNREVNWVASRLGLDADRAPAAA